MAGAGLGQGAEQVAPGGGEVPGLVFGVLRPRPSAESFTSYNRECEVNLLNVHIRGWNTVEKNTCALVWMLWNQGTRCSAS